MNPSILYAERLGAVNIGQSPFIDDPAHTGDELVRRTHRPHSAHEERNVVCTFPPQFQPYLDELTIEANTKMATHHKDRVDAWTKGGRRGPEPRERDFSKYISIAHKLRLAASIPALARLNVEDHIELTGDEEDLESGTPTNLTRM